MKYGPLLSDGRMDAARLLQHSKLWKYLKEKSPSPLKESDCVGSFFPEEYGYAVGIIEGELRACRGVALSVMGVTGVQSVPYMEDAFALI